MRGKAYHIGEKLIHRWSTPSKENWQKNGYTVVTYEEGGWWKIRRKSTTSLSIYTTREMREYFCTYKGSAIEEKYIVR